MSRELTPKTGQFDEIISIIDNARTRALKAVNAELIQMYWNVGTDSNVLECWRIPFFAVR